MATQMPSEYEMGRGTAAWARPSVRQGIYWVETQSINWRYKWKWKSSRPEGGDQEGQLHDNRVESQKPCLGHSYQGRQPHILEALPPDYNIKDEYK